MNKWFRHKEHRNAVAKLVFHEHLNVHRLTFYHVVKDDLEVTNHEEVTKEFYIDPQEAIDTLAKLDYEEE